MRVEQAPCTDVVGLAVHARCTNGILPVRFPWLQHMRSAQGSGTYSITIMERESSVADSGFAGLVCFALNLVLATWIKFSDMSTRIVVTTLLALSLVFVGRLLAFWAPHLFSRRPWSDDALRAHVLQLGNDTGLPFAWHRVPRPADVPQVRLYRILVIELSLVPVQS